MKGDITSIGCTVAIVDCGTLAKKEEVYAGCSWLKLIRIASGSGKGLSCGILFKIMEDFWNFGIESFELLVHFLV